MPNKHYSKKPWNYRVPDLEGELWKDIIGYEGVYQVSNLGRVKSLAREIRSVTATTGYRWKREALMASCPGRDRRYPCAVLNYNYTQRNLYVHLMMLETFVGSCPEGMEGCHNDGDPTNCVLSNLRWDTHINNLGDAIQQGRMGKGENNGYSKLTDHDIYEIRRLWKTGDYKQREIASKFGIWQATVSRIVSRKSWTHLD